MVREYLRKRKTDFKEYDISDNPKALDWVKNHAPVIATPILDIDGQVIVGFDRQKIDEALAA